MQKIKGRDTELHGSETTDLLMAKRMTSQEDNEKKNPKQKGFRYLSAGWIDQFLIIPSTRDLTTDGKKKKKHASRSSATRVSI